MRGSPICVIFERLKFNPLLSTLTHTSHIRVRTFKLVNTVTHVLYEVPEEIDAELKGCILVEYKQKKRSYLSHQEVHVGHVRLRASDSGQIQIQSTNREPECILISDQ